MKNCLECAATAPDDALTCAACGGGSWSAPVVESEPAPDPVVTSKKPKKS